MADLKISQFVDGGAVQPTDEIATNRAGTNTKVSVGSAAALDAGGGLGDLVQLEDVGGGTPGLPAVDGSQLTNLPAPSGLGTAAYVDTGTASGEVPLNSDLGTAAYLDTGTGDTDVVTGAILKGTKRAYTVQQNFAEVAITSTSNSIAWNLDSAQTAVHTTTENTTLANPTNMVAGGTYILRFVQGATPRTLAFGSAYRWPGGVAPTVSTGSGAVDILTFYSDGTNMMGVIQKGFA